MSNYLLKAINEAATSFMNFFDTTPELMSEETAKRLRNKVEAKELIDEIQQKRVNKELIEANP